jgi:colanic acid/amylovoran biosynthesis protein
LGLSARKVVLLPDMALFNQGRDEESAKGALGRLGISGNYITSTAIEWYFPFQDDATDARENYMSNLMEALRRLSSDFKARILFLKQIEAAHGIVGDSPLLAELRGRARDCVSICEEDLSPQTMRGIIGGACLHIGSRMHSNIFALQAGTPFVAISYLPKTQSIMRMLGLSEFVADIAALQAEQLVALCKQSVSETHRFQAARLRAAEVGESGKREFLKLLAELVSPANPVA